MSYIFENKLVYNFNVYPEAVMGSDWKKVTVMGTVTADIARTYVDIEALHARVYPYLPEGTVNSASGYDYLLVKTNNGTTTVIGLVCIIEDSVEVVSGVSVDIRVTNILNSDVEIIRQALIQNGFNDFEITVN